MNALYKRHTPEEIDAILDEQMGSESSAESSSRETQRYGSPVDKAYDDLVNGNNDEIPF